MGKRGFPSKALILFHLDFSEATGEFHWKRPTSNRVKVGYAAGCTGSHGYIWITLCGCKCSAHQLAWIVSRNSAPPKLIDHVNGVKSDNRPSNLRAATFSENAANSRAHKDSKSGIKGIHRHYDGRWRAQIRVGNKRVHLGCFDTPSEAHSAYHAAAVVHFGQFANDGGDHRQA